MADLSTLILDDDELWLTQHERRLTQAGFKCRSTQLAKEVIDIVKTDPSIKFALIDEILFVTPTFGIGIILYPTTKAKKSHNLS